MKKVFFLFTLGLLTSSCLVACNKDKKAEETDNLPTTNTTPAELMNTEWVATEFAVWNGYRIYHNGELYNRQTHVWYSGMTDAADLNPDATTGIYFGDKRFVTTLISSTSSNGGCRSNKAQYCEGVPEFKGNRIIFHPKFKREKSKSVCSPSNNYDYDVEVAKEEYTYTLGTKMDPDNYEYYTLTLTDANGNSSVFFRRKG